MNGEPSYEDLITSISSMSKTQVKERLLHFKGRPRLDFTESFLDGLTTDRLRHILLAAMITSRRH